MKQTIAIALTSAALCGFAWEAPLVRVASVTGGIGGGIDAPTVTTIVYSAMTETNPAFSNAVLAVGIDTNALARVGAVGELLADLPVDPTTGGVTLLGLLAALLAAVAALKRGKFDAAKVSAADPDFSAAVAGCFDDGDATAYPREEA